MDKGSVCTIKEFSKRKLQSVEFILDYLRLHFDGVTITAITWPTIQTDEAHYQYGDSEYRNILCCFIGQDLDFVQVSEDDEALIQFEGKLSLTISLKPNDYVGAEAILLRAHDNDDLWVW